MKEILISYVGKVPVECDFARAERDEIKKAKREKRAPRPFLKLAMNKSRVLTLRPYTTTMVSESELEVVKSVLGELAFKRVITVHDLKPKMEKRKAPSLPSMPRSVVVPKKKKPKGDG